MFRKRSSIFLKLIIGFGVAWMFLLATVGIFSLEKVDTVAEVLNPRNENWGNKAGDTSNKIPFLERPDIDRLRFQDAMKRDAEEEMQRVKGAEEELQRRDEERRMRARDRVVPPFKDVFKQQTELQVIPNVGLAKSQQTGLIDAQTQKCIDEGLIVPKWNIDKEPMAKPSMNWTGEQGQGINIIKENLSPEERKKFDDGWQNNAFNEYASNLMSLHRSLPDVRDAECKSIKYREKLPSASVIIIFHNEARTVLHRTVQSVLDRSPPHLVKEVILVDDFSTFEHLKQPLEDHIKPFGKVKVVRGKKREGLIRARLLGASVATAEVLIFLDSHCECAMGWLEPLLDRIADNKSNVVAPIIDVLADDSLRYQYSSAKSTSVGGFDWNLQFNWHVIPERERKRHKSVVEPVASPTMAGGLFGISREYFEYLGTYDPGMDIWGGENLELSFRVWMCGGQLEVVLCSHVGHIFRKRSPYKWVTGVNIVKKNSVRLAEVWMDDYKQYYYQRFNFDLGEYGDVTARKELRRKLNCKSFDWYLKNVFPELFVPADAVATGEIRCKALGSFNTKKEPACIDSPVDKNAHNKAVKMWPCHNQGGNQHWMLSATGEIRRDEGCIDYAGDFVMIYPCHGAKGNQEWVYGKDNSLRHVNTNKCLTLSEDGTKPVMEPCTGIDRQIWQWRRKPPPTSSLPPPSSKSR